METNRRRRGRDGQAHGGGGRAGRGGKETPACMRGDGRQGQGLGLGIVFALLITESDKGKRKPEAMAAMGHSVQ